MRSANRLTCLALVTSLALFAGCSDDRAVVGGFFDATLADTSDAAEKDRTTPPPDVAPDLPADVRVGCAANADCAGSMVGAVCDVSTGRCVECVASDTCPEGRYCGAGNRCLAGCRDDMACVTPADGGTLARRCDPTSRACVDCLADEHCAPGNRCVGNVCVAGCSAARVPDGPDLLQRGLRRRSGEHRPLRRLRARLHHRRRDPRVPHGRVRRRRVHGSLRGL